MVNSCLKCGRGNEKDKDITLFQVPIDGKDAKWQMEFLNRIEIPGFLDKEVYICERHFSPEDFEMKNSVLHLKENALPVKDDDLEEQLEIKPEVIYFKNDDVIEVGADAMSDSSETKDLVPLEPLVEYMSVYEEAPEEIELSSIKSDEAGVHPGAESIIIDAQYLTEDNVGREISVVSSDADSLTMEPVMPFFLTSSPMFTILNDGDEVGETIILQIEDAEDNRRQPPPPKEAIEELHYALCKSPTGSITTTYACDICDAPFGCINCLKSHYETLHIYNLVRRYKCKFSHHVSRSLVCPVCDLTFQTRSETMDHYVTHSVACKICGSGFDRHAHLVEHYKSAHNKGGDHQVGYECELCKMSYQYSATLTKHYRTFHKMALCHVCKGRFATVGELQEHEKVHLERLNVLPFACSKCDKAFPRISDIAVHIRQDHKREAEEGGAGSLRIEQTPVQKKVKVKK